MSVQFFANDTEEIPVASLTKRWLEQHGQEFGFYQDQNYNTTVFSGNWAGLRAMAASQNITGIQYVQIFNSPLYEVSMDIGNQSFNAYSRRMFIELGSSSSADDIPVHFTFRLITPRPVVPPSVRQAQPSVSNTPTDPNNPSQPSVSNTVTRPSISNTRTRPLTEKFGQCDNHSVFYYLLVFVLLILAFFIVYYAGCSVTKSMSK